MRNRARLFCIFTLCTAGLLVVLCGKKNSPTGPGDNGGGGTTEAYNYTVSVDTIIVSLPQRTDTAIYCDPVADTLVTEYAVIPAHDSTLLYRISSGNDTLMLYHTTDTSLFSRSGSGSGLIGTWTAAGTVPLNSWTQLVFTATAVTVTMRTCYAEEFINNEWPFDSAYFSVRVVQISCTSVQLTGDTTNERVTISWNGAGDATFSSTTTGHVAYTCRKKPLACPNNPYPDWYYPYFLYLNPK
jgi:hypothetical protein